MNDKMLYVIAYDIASDKQRGKVHNVLSGYGKWTQYSLFECHLTPLQHTELHYKISKLINPDTDSLRFYPLCAGCVKRVETVGGVPPEDPPLFLL
jgi:CRISPR-associated protein Cas2